MITGPRLVGRERELATLRAAVAGPSAVVLVEGEAGVGKSRLVRELLAGGQVPAAVGVCPPFREGLTLGPIVDAVRQVRPGLAGLRLSPLAGALRPVLPEWAGQLPSAPEPLVDPRAARHRLFRALAELLDALAVPVLVVEDLHWADDATLDLLLFLGSRPAAPGLVVTYRPEDVPPESVLWRLSSRPQATRIRLGTLAAAETAALVSSMLGDQPVADDLAEFLHAHTDGLPLAVEESVRLLWERSELVRRDGGWARGPRDPLPVPPGIRDAVRERLARLPAAAGRLVTAAAVLAEPVADPVLRQVADLPADRAERGLRAALAAGLLSEDQPGRVGFRHVLMGRAVYEAIPGPERRRWHRSAGQVLAGLEPAPVGQLARHFREAGEPRQWCRYAELAADQALAAADHTSAVGLLMELVTADLPASTRLRLTRRLGDATLSRPEEMDRLNLRVVQAMRSLLGADDLDRSGRAEVRDRLGRLLIQLGDWEAGYRELERAAPDLGHNPVEAARVMTYLGLPSVGVAPAAVHRRWLRRAAELGPRIRSAADRISLTGDRAVALLLLGDPHGWAVAAGLPASAVTRDERWQLSRCWANLANGAMLWGRDQQAGRWLAVAERLAEVDRIRTLRYMLGCLRLRLDWLRGDWAGLPGLLTELVEVDTIRPSGYAGVMCAAGQLQAVQAAWERAEEYFWLALDLARQRGVVDDVPEPAAWLAQLRLAGGRVAEALQVTDEPIRVVAGKGTWVWATSLAPVRVEALLAAGRSEEAYGLVGAFARGLRGRDAPAPRAGLALCRALLAGQDHGRAAAGFARAAGAWDRGGRPYDALLARERQAAGLLEAGREPAGVALLTEVHQGLQALGAPADADRVARRLRERGADVPRPWRGGRRGYGDQLSPKELEVVRLVAAGRTNREIAALLSRSPHTVSTQVKSAMRKLGASSRTALAVSAVGAGVVAAAPPDPPTIQPCSGCCGAAGSGCPTPGCRSRTLPI